MPYMWFGIPRMPGNPSGCFSYPTGSGCFSYPADEPLGIRDRNAAQRAASDLRKMGEASGCFSY